MKLDSSLGKAGYPTDWAYKLLARILSKWTITHNHARFQHLNPAVLLSIHVGIVAGLPERIASSCQLIEAPGLAGHAPAQACGGRLQRMNCIVLNTRIYRVGQVSKITTRKPGQVGHNMLWATSCFKVRAAKIDLNPKPNHFIHFMKCSHHSLLCKAPQDSLTQPSWATQRPNHIVSAYTLAPGQIVALERSRVYWKINFYHGTILLDFHNFMFCLVTVSVFTTVQNDQS